MIVNQLRLLLLAGVLSTAACASKQPAEKPDAAAFETAITAAETAQKKAASVNGEWRDTGKLIKSAKSAAKQGDYAKAIQYADKARSQGELGFQQAMEQKNAGLPSYFK